MAQILKSYTIKPGDSLSRIATRFGITLMELLDVNEQISNPDLIQVGQIINIPVDDPMHALKPVGAAFDGVTPAAGTTVMARARLTHPPLTNSIPNRQAEVYTEVIDQFAVGHNPRHLPTGGFTFCNIFLWDVTRAMGAEIPHWIDSTGRIVQPFAADARETTINAVVDWLKRFGSDHGWTKVSQQEAQDNANAGCPAVVVWKNPTGGHGHTAVIRPGTITNEGPLTAQAGSRNFNVGRLKHGFGTRQGLQFYIHA